MIKPKLSLKWTVLLMVGIVLYTLIVLLMHENVALISI
jgi:hypothetical protein